MLKKIKKLSVVSAAVILPTAAIVTPIVVTQTKQADGFLHFILNIIPEKNHKVAEEGRKFYRGQELISRYQADVKTNIYNIFWSDTVLWRSESESIAKTTEVPIRIEQVKRIVLSGIGSPGLSLKGSIDGGGPSGTATLDIKPEVSSEQVIDRRYNTKYLFSDITVDAWIWKIANLSSDVISWFYFANSTYSVSAKNDKNNKIGKRYSV